MLLCKWREFFIIDFLAQFKDRVFKNHSIKLQVSLRYSLK